MTQLEVTVEHPDAHEPNGETFREDFSKALTKALAEQGLKRGEGEPTIAGYTQISGVATTYRVELDTEQRAGSGDSDTGADGAKSTKSAKGSKG